MCEKTVLELVLHWLGDASVPGNVWMLNKDCYEEHLQCITRLLATSRLNSPSARNFVDKCWRALLGQYNMVLRRANDDGFCMPVWYHSEKKRLKQLQEKGPKHALASMKDAMKWYTTDQHLIFEVGGGDRAAETYLDYLEVKQSLPAGDPESSDDEAYDDDILINHAMSDSDSGSEASSSVDMTDEMQMYQDWVIMLNAQRWISVTTMIQKCPGMRPFGGVLNSLCQDSLAFEQAWVKSWPIRWRTCIPLP